MRHRLRFPINLTGFYLNIDLNCIYDCEFSLSVVCKFLGSQTTPGWWFIKGHDC